MRAFFDPRLQEIKDLADYQLEEFPEISTIFIVGGFGRSQYLVESLKKRYLPRNKIVTTVPKAAESIMIGAVLLGLRNLETIKPIC